MAPSSATATCTEVLESPSRKGETPSNVADVEAIFMPKISLTGSGKAGASPASSVHELLECPVCTNSMYPPIHQVSNIRRGNCFLRLFRTDKSASIHCVKPDLFVQRVGSPQVVLGLDWACSPL
jgi:hypothetical protein